MSFGLRGIGWIVAAALVVGGAVSAWTQEKQPEKTPRIEDFAWLAGGWKFEEHGVVVEETWIAPAGKTMLAVGRTIRGESTVFFEFLRLEARKNGVFYVAHPGGRSPGTDFKLTKWDGREAVFENPEHDFPTLIRYVKNENGSLTARVEGTQGGQPASEEYRYERMAK